MHDTTSAVALLHMPCTVSSYSMRTARMHISDEQPVTLILLCVMVL